MTESNSSGSEGFKNLPLPLSLIKDPAISKAEIRPRTPEEVAQDLLQNQGFVSKNLPESVNPVKKRVSVLTDIISEEQILLNRAAGLPDSFISIPVPNPLMRRSEGTRFMRRKFKASK